MAQGEKKVVAKNVISVLFFEIFQKFFFPLLDKTFMHLYSRSQVDIAKNAYLGIPQVFRTHFGTHCSILCGAQSREKEGEYMIVTSSEVFCTGKCLSL